MPTPAAPRFPDGAYEIEGMLGSGAMAIVYRARDVRRSRDVAVKVLRPELSQIVGAERFRREIAVVSRLSHPHILPLLDTGQADAEDGTKAPYYVMPLVEGETLQQRITRETRLPLPDALRIARDILDALQYAHAHGVLHRDVKPANVMLSGEHAIVADFGLARLIDGTDLAMSGNYRLTSTGFVVGSPTYMSPEQALGEADLDERSDIFSLGCVLYEMLTGAAPFDAPTAQSILARKVNGMFIPVHVMRPGIPEAVHEVLKRALAPERSDRHANAADLRREIDEIDTGVRSMSRLAPVGRTAPRRMALIGAGLALVTAAAFVARRHSESVPPLGTSAGGGFEQSHIAVLPLEVAPPDSALAFLAEGFTTDLIDELARYPALTVISRNGVRALARTTLTPDSIARVLRVGSIITGEVQRIGDSVRVAVRLVDAASNAQVGKADVIGGAKELLRLRNVMIDSVTGFLRVTIGARIAQRERQAVGNAEAWLLVAEAREIMDSELSRALSWSMARRARRFSDVEQKLAKAARLDTQWPAPEVIASRLFLTRADLEEVIAFTSRGGDQRIANDASPATLPDAFRRRALQHAERALARDADDADALRERGSARMALVTNAPELVVDTLVSGAESDFRRAVALRKDMAPAWSELSRVLQFKGDYAGSADAATSALEADAFLARPEAVMSRLTYTTLASGRVDDARAWCARGQARFRDDPRFWGCDLTILGWTGDTPALVDSAWRLLEAGERRDSLNLLVTGWGTRRLLVAAVAARAGLADSARSIAARVRAAESTAAGATQNDYSEAYVQTLLGRSDLAITLLARYLNAQPSQRGAVRSTPWFAKLRRDERFIRLTAPR